MSILRGLREERGWTQKDLAEKLKTKASTISILETGRRRMSYEYAVRLAEVFETNPDVFLSNGKAALEISGSILVPVVGKVSTSVQYSNKKPYKGLVESVSFSPDMATNTAHDGKYVALEIDVDDEYKEAILGADARLGFAICIDIEGSQRPTTRQDTIFERVDNNEFHHYRLAGKSPLPSTGYMMVGFIAYF